MQAIGYELPYTLYVTHALSAACLHMSSEQPIGIVVTRVVND